MVGRIISILSILVSVFWIQQGLFQYQFWGKDSPGGGFIPVLFGVIVAAASVSVLLRRREKSGDYKSIELTSFIPVAGAVAGILLLQFFGILPAVLLFTFLWMKFLSKYSWLKSLAVSLIFSAFIIGVFRMWLHVPFPKGIFG